MAAVTLSACAAPGGLSADERVRGTIIRYDRLLAEGYRTMDMSRLTSVAEQSQAEKEYIHMSSLGEGGVRLLPYLVHFEFVAVSVETTTARVQTRETWDFLHEDRTTHKVVLEQRDLTYDVAWALSLHPDGRWYVRDLRVISGTSTVEPSRLGTPTPGAEGF